MSDEDLWTADEVAREVGVEPGTIYTWVRRGALRSVSQRGRYKLFRLSDVFAAEASRQDRHRRKTSRLRRC